MKINDTITAIATSASNAGIGIIRISGSDAVLVADRIFCAKNKKKLADAASHTIHYGYIMAEAEPVDEVLVMLMKAPNSYTKEDTVEIDCHGGNLVMHKILELVIQNGARPAEPGEFTKRAFLNGRIDLTQAESVIDLINSKNDFALKSSISQLRGSVLNKIKSLRKIILYETAWIESAIDDPEHYTLDGYDSHLTDILDQLIKEIQILLKNADNGRILKEGIHTVIVGKPNVGKSSLLNFLTGSDRAIVTNVAGTTRDILEEQVNINGMSLHIIDTAGIRETEDVVEKIGVTKTKEYLEKADLVLYMVDGSDAFTEEDRMAADMIKDKKVIVLLNKSDLRCCVKPDDLAQISSHILSISAKEGDGIQELADLIGSMFSKGEISFNDQVVITNIRHKDALVQALESLTLVKESIAQQMPEDFYSIDLLHAYEVLGTIIGASITDDLVDEIFSKFCMGK